MPRGVTRARRRRSGLGLLCGLLGLLAGGCLPGEPPVGVPAPEAGEAGEAGSRRQAARVLEDAVKEALGGGGTPAAERFAIPDEAQMAAMRTLVAALVAGMRAPDPAAAVEPLRPQALALGFRLVRLAHGSQASWSLAEREGGWGGRGLYLFLEHPGARTAVFQAPHPRADLHTELLAARAYGLGQAAACFVATAHRQLVPPADKERVGAADVANYPRSYFLAATKGAADGIAGARFIQWHGFAQNKENREIRQQLVLSSGDKEWTGELAALARQLDRLLGAQAVGRYRVDVFVLGASQNVQGQFIRGQTDDRFVHVEMNEELRKRLKGSQELLQEFSNALTTSVIERP